MKPVIDGWNVIKIILLPSSSTPLVSEKFSMSLKNISSWIIWFILWTKKFTLKNLIKGF